MNYKHIFLCAMLLPLICAGCNLIRGGKNQKSDTPKQETSGGSGLYYEVSMLDTTQQGFMKSHLKIYINPAGDVRMETQATVPVIGKMDMIQLYLKDDPTHILLINDKKKVYAVRTMMQDTSIPDETDMPAITKVGSETANGFPCTILKFTSSSDTAQVWISDAIPGYKRLADVLSRQNGGSGSAPIEKMLEKKGYKGFWVKYIATGGPMKGMTMKLTKAEHKNVPGSLMKAPTGYTKIKGNPFATNAYSKTIHTSTKTDVKIGK